MRTTHHPGPALTQAPSPRQTRVVGKGRGGSRTQSTRACLSQTPPPPLASLSQPGEVQCFFESNCKALSSRKLKIADGFPPPLHHHHLFQSDCRRWGSVRRDSGQGTGIGSPPSREAPICQAGLEEGLSELTPMSISLGGLPPNSHLCGSSRSTLRMGMLSEARRQEARTWEQGWGSVLGEERPLQAGVRKPPRPWQSQTNAETQGCRRERSTSGLGPSYLGPQANPYRV